MGVMPGDAIMKPVFSKMLEERLKTVIVGRVVYHYENVPSTNDVAHRLGREGVPEGAVIIAGSQSEGRGRGGKAWFSPSDVNLYCSVVLRPELPPQDVPLLTLISSVVLVDTLESYGVKGGIKWPNDILVDGRKVAGVLTEASTTGGRVDFLVLGFGVNVNATRALLDSGLGGDAKGATSLVEILGREVDLVEFAASLLTRLEEWYLAFLREGRRIIVAAWNDRSIMAGRRVEVQEATGAVVGKVLGIDAEGHLVVEPLPGKTHRVISGDVRLIS